MKKLSLKKLKLEKSDLIERNQLKTVIGGYGGYGGYGDTGSCYYLTGRDGDGAPIGGMRVSMDEAKEATSNGGNWCCSSCDSASWLIEDGEFGFELV